MTSTIVDLLLLLLLASYGIGGYRHGLVLNLLSLVGFVIGGIAGILVLPTVLGWWTWLDDHGFARTVALVVGVFVAATLGQTLFGRVGAQVRSMARAPGVRWVDSVLGMVSSVLAVSVLVWFIAGALRPAVPASMARAINGSQVLHLIDRVIPPGTGQLFTSFRAFLDREGFPRVFGGLQPEPITAVPAPDATVTSSRGVQLALRSVVKVTGLAQACGQGQEGSGFVVAPERVVTNAHVVAGMSAPTVRVGGVGRSHEGRVVAFDPLRDLAVIAVAGLSAPPLARGPVLASGDDGVVAGFPLDGPLRLDAARVRTTLTATGDDIYGRSGARREVYSLFAQVQQGNSGGPLLTTSGQLAGVIFAKSLDDASTGYALTLAEAQPVLDRALDASTAVDTGGCALR